MAFRPTRAASVLPPESESTGTPEWVAEDKWKLVSHLQKAVRRGRADDAAWATEQLYALDPAYLRYRLSVIAAEEMAGGSPEVVDAYLGEGWTKKITEDRGGQSFLVQAARDFAQAPKDRTPCTWMSCSYWQLEFESQHGLWAAMPVAQALDLAWDRTQPWWVRGLAAWRAAGTDRFPSGWLPKQEGDWPAWQQRVADEGFSAVHRSALAAGAHQREAHPVFVALAWDAQRQEHAQVQRLPVLELGYVGPWLSAALDKHTSEGKKALRQLFRQTPEGQAWNQSHGLDEAAATEAVGRLWFWMEGGQVDVAISYPTATAIELATKQRFLAEQVFTGRELFAQWGAQPERWHAARHQALGLPIPVLNAARPKP